MAIDLGTAATQDSSAFATAAQGAKADSAVQQIQGGTGVVVDSSNPQKPVVSFSGPGTGTVTNTSVTAANGFTGTVTNPTTTPAIAIGTSIAGILKGNGTSVSAAVAADFPTLNQNTTGYAGSLTSVASISALRALSVSGVVSGQSIELAGYYAANDGGGGVFVWNATSGASDNGGTIIKPTGVSTGRWYRIYNEVAYLEWFGAKGDGVTDDTSTFQSALSACYTLDNSLYGTAGKTYLVSGITISQTNSSVPPILDLQLATIKATTGATTAVSIENPHAIQPGFIFRNAVINGNSISTVGMNVHGSQSCTYENIEAINCTGYGIQIDGEPSFGVYYNMFRNLGSGQNGGSNNGGIREESTANSGGYYNASNTFLNCRTQYNKYNGTANFGYGWSIDYASNTHIGCEAEVNDNVGVWFNHNVGAQWIGGYTENNGAMGATNGAGVGNTITAASWASSVATLTIGNHPFLVGMTVTISSVNPTGYNGTYVLTAVTATTVSYALASNPGTYVSGGTCLNSDYSFSLSANTPTGVVILPGRNIGLTFFSSLSTLGSNNFLMSGNPNDTMWSTLALNYNNSFHTPTSPVSGTVYQNTTGATLDVYLPVTFTPTSGASATCIIQLGGSASPTTMGIETVPAGTALDNFVRVLHLRVPNLWYYSFTISNCTFGTIRSVLGG